MISPFPDLAAVADRWRKHWALTQRIAPNLSRQDQLDRSLTAFLAQEIEDDNDEHEKLLVLHTTLAGVICAGTHDRIAIELAAERLFKSAKSSTAHTLGRWVGSILGHLDARYKRIALLFFPFLAVVDGFLLARDLDHFRWEPSLAFVLFLMLASGCLLLAFTRLGDWVFHE